MSCHQTELELIRIFPPALGIKKVVLLGIFSTGMHFISDKFTDEWYPGFIYYSHFYLFIIKQDELYILDWLETLRAVHGSACSALGLKACTTTPAILKFGYAIVLLSPNEHT